MAGWGTVPWGLGPWGFGAEARLFFTNAFPISDRILRVTLSREPRHTSALHAGDALNPRSWTVYRNDTNQVFTVLAVRPGSLHLVWDLYLLQALGPWGVEHTVISTNLRDSSGTLLGDPNSFEFQGCLTPAEQPKAKIREYDLANDGTLKIDSSGDYAKVQGEALLRKLITRRLLTLPGTLFFLTDYGLGIRIKEPLNTTSLVALRAEVERQIKQEPEVSNVSVSLRMSTDGVLTISVKARLTNGTEATVAVPVGTKVE